MPRQIDRPKQGLAGDLLLAGGARPTGDLRLAANLRVLGESLPSLSVGVANLGAALSGSPKALARDNIPDLTAPRIRLVRLIRSNAEEVRRPEHACSQTGVPRYHSRHRSRIWPSLTRITTRSLIVLRPPRCRIAAKRRRTGKRMIRCGQSAPSGQCPQPPAQRPGCDTPFRSSATIGIEGPLSDARTRSWCCLVWQPCVLNPSVTRSASTRPARSATHPLRS